MITEVKFKDFNLVRGGAHSAQPAEQQAPALPGTPAPAESKPSKNLEDLVIDAYKGGLADGEVQHYRSGWRWGLVCGLLWGAGLAVLAQWCAS